MQEELEHRTVTLMVSSGKFTGKTLKSAMIHFLNYSKHKVQEHKDVVPHGKQTVKELIGQNQGVSNMDIAKTDLRGFEKVAQKYGVDYAIRKDASQQPPRYIVFFKARDADALTAAFKEYSAAVMKKKDRPSVLKALKKMKELVASIPDKVRNKDKEHTL